MLKIIILQVLTIYLFTKCSEEVFFKVFSNVNVAIAEQIGNVQSSTANAPTAITCRPPLTTVAPVTTNPLVPCIFLTTTSTSTAIPPCQGSLD